MTKSHRPVRSAPAPAAGRQSALDRAAAIAVVLFAGLISLFAIRSNDVWWLLAVGRRLVETKSFITRDPFTFTAAGTPWAPQWYLAALLYFAVHSVASAWGLIVVRALLVTTTFTVMFVAIRAAGARWLYAAPVVLVALLNAHSRFLVRAHLFEYLFISILVWFLLTAGRRNGKSFFAIPVALQLLWVNTHPSFLLGPALVVMFFASEWVALQLSPKPGIVVPFDPRGYNWRRVAILVLLMILACLVNPAPGLFLAQPLGSEQRELISRFTLEWRSPFDPALRHGAFHPYYEILLGLAAVSILAAVPRLPLAPVVLTVATAVLSFQAHRFRVEFALVAVPMIFVLLRSSPLSGALGRRLRDRGGGTLAARIAAAALSLVLIGTAVDRVDMGDAVADRYPEKAFRWIAENDVAHRPFNTIGEGSYLLWSLYGQRSSFIDGRNFSPAVYRDFLACQMSERGRRSVAARYKLDAFVLPSIELADAGVERLHRSLARDEEWTLGYVDRLAWIYVKNSAVDPGWLERNGFHAYHPLTLHNRQMTERRMRAVTGELERAVDLSPGYLRTRVDLALLYLAAGRTADAAAQIDRALAIDPQNKTALEIRGRLRNPAR